MTIFCTWTARSSRTFFSRSCVMGRAVTIPWRAKAMAVASMAPIQMGRTRAPSRSLRSTMGWLVGSSTRTPTRLISIIPRPNVVSRPRYDSRPQDAGSGLPVGPVERRGEQRQHVGICGQRGHVLDRHDALKVAVPLTEIKPVADHEAVRAIETHVPERQGRDPANGLVQQRAHLQGAGGPRPQRSEQVRQGEPGVDDVLHHQDVRPADVLVEVFHDPDHSRRLRAAPVGRDGHEVDADGQLDGAEQVRQEYRAPFEDRDEDGVAPAVIGGDASAELFHSAMEVGSAVEHRCHVRHPRPIVPLPPVAPSEVRLGSVRPQPNSDQKAWRVNRATATAPRRHHGDPAGAPLGTGEGDGPGAAADATTMDTAPSVRPFTTKRTDPTLVPAGSGSSSPGRTRTRDETFRTPAAGTSGDRSPPATTGRALVPTGTGARACPLLA